jgi:hypothetical protein
MYRTNLDDTTNDKSVSNTDAMQEDADNTNLVSNNRDNREIVDECTK